MLNKRIDKKTTSSEIPLKQLEQFKHHKQQQQIKISAIIPIFNEEKGLSSVIDFLFNCDVVDEIICVNDGSKDHSLMILQSYAEQIKLVNFEQNQGKGAALAAGIEIAQGEIVLFLDADLLNLKVTHIVDLIHPLLAQECRGTLGIMDDLTGDLLPNPFMYFTGQRSYFRQDLLPYLAEIRQARFGVEVFLNELFPREQIQMVAVPGLGQIFKSEKTGYLGAFRGYLVEGMEIAQEIGRRKGFLPEDRMIISRLKNVASLEEFQKQIKKIHNLTVRQFLHEYVLKYLKMIKFE